MPEQSNRGHPFLSRARKFVPMAIGLAVTACAVLLNYYLIQRRLPKLVAPVSAYSAALEREASENGSRPDSAEVGDSLDILAGLFAAFDDQVTDLMFSLQPEGRNGKAGDEVRIVVIDSESLDRLGHWPWSRRDVAKLVEKIEGAKVIGFDLLFAESDRTSPVNYVDFFRSLPGAALNIDASDNERFDNDLSLLRAIGHGRTVMGFSLDNDVSRREAWMVPGNFKVVARLPGGAPLPPDKALLKMAKNAVVNLDLFRDFRHGPAGEGFFNVFPNESGVVRRVPMLMTLNQGWEHPENERRSAVYPALALEMYRVGIGADTYVIRLDAESNRLPAYARGVGDDGRRHYVEGLNLAKSRPGGGEDNLASVPLNELGELTVNYYGPNKGFRFYPAWEVLAGMHDGAFKDKYVLIGASLSALRDVRANALTSARVPTIEVHASLVDGLIRGGLAQSSVRANYFWQQFCVVVAGVAMSCLLLLPNVASGALLWALVMAFLTFGNYFFFFRRGIVCGVTMPVQTATAVFVVQLALNYLLLGRERRFIRKAFSLNVSPAILDYLERHPDRLSSLEGEQRDMTVLFSDIRGFTAMSENMTAPDLARFLNEYLTPMSDIVMRNMGTVDKFIGDALMAFWNAPTDDLDHARNAARAALAMRDILGSLQIGWTARGLPAVRIGCGINSGPMFAGYIGSEQRKNYTVMGDNVNIASRLEGLNKIYGSDIIVSEATRNAIGSGFACCVIDKVRVSGRREPVLIYELLGEGLHDEAKGEEIATFEKVFELYQNRQFSRAESLLRDLNELTPRPLYGMYMDRLAVYLALPPEPGWDGTFTVTQK